MHRDRGSGDCEMATAYSQETETDRPIPQAVLAGEEGGNHSSEEELEEINMCKVCKKKRSINIIYIFRSSVFMEAI